MIALYGRKDEEWSRTESIGIQTRQEVGKSRTSLEPCILRCFITHTARAKIGVDTGSATSSGRREGVEQTKGRHIDFARLWTIKPDHVKIERVGGFKRVALF